MISVRNEFQSKELDGLEDLPSNWQVCRLKHLFKIQNGATPKSEVSEFWGGDLVWVTPADISKLKSEYISNSAKNITRAGLDSCGTTLVPEGTIVLSTRAPIGSICIAERKLCTNQGCKSLVPKNEVNSKFYYYYLRVSKEFLNLKGSGTTFLELPTYELANFSAPLPTIDIQNNVVFFLDREVYRIENLISEKQNFINLLKEKRQALISHIVTKGTELTGIPNDKHDLIEINPKFGIVPFTKYVVDKSDYRGKTPNKTDSGVFLVTAKNIKMGYIDYSASSEYVSEDDYENVMSRGKPKIGDILLTTEAPLGNIALVDDEDIALAQRVIRFRIDSSHFNSAYALYLMTSDFFQNQLRKVATGITAQGIKASKLGGLKVVRPPLEEQKQIVNLIETKINPINRLIAEVDSSIELLKEHRTALISAAVTGKIDLRKKEVA